LILANIRGSAAWITRQSCLVDKEVILTFGDGPVPCYTNPMLDILAAQCAKATFFLVGEMAHTHPAAACRIYAEGHTIGTHSEDHPLRFGKLPIEKVRWEIGEGTIEVGAALGDPREFAPFFRIRVGPIGLSSRRDLRRGRLSSSAQTR
jgi:peptidoglycan/xylan/chitin deacetylase (PgdA/CDA1 family)